jgi:hypothetical protein
MAEQQPNQSDPPTKAEHRKAVIAAGLMFYTLERAAQLSLAAVASVAASLGRANAHDTAALIALAETSAIVRVRKSARAKSAASFEAQAGLSRAALKDPIALDTARARKAATSLGNQFSELVTKARAERVASRLKNEEDEGRAGQGPLRIPGVPTATERREERKIATTHLESSIDRTAATEVADAWNHETRRMVDHWTARGVDIVTVWNAEADACDKCHALHGLEIEADEDFPEGDPPLHPRCLPGDALVLTGGDVTGSCERWYEGDLIIIRTASGKRLACTPNHPVLTGLGWVSAGRVNVGGHVISDARVDWMLPLGAHDEHVPSRIEEVAYAFGVSDGVNAMTVPLSAPDFHGDGAGSKVAVVWADRLLRNTDDASLTEQRGKLNFVRTDGERICFAGLSPEDEPFDGLRRAADSRVRGGDLPVPCLADHAGPLVSLGFGTSARLEASSNEPIVNSRPADTEPLAGGEHGLTVTVAPDEVIGVDREPFHGTVFNLETGSGTYLAQGIVTHNCRCRLDIHVRD